MQQLSRFIWFARFLCVLSLVLAVLFARQGLKIERENRLATLAVERSATSTAANVFLWQKAQSEKLAKLAQGFVQAAAEEQSIALADIGSFRALFVTDADGLITVIQPGDFFSAMPGFFRPTRGQLAGPYTMFLPAPFSLPVLALPFTKDDEQFVLYAVVRMENFALFLRADEQSQLTIIDNNENIIISTDKTLKTGTNRLEQLGEQYVSTGGGFFKKELNESAIAYRANTRGFFGWAIFCERQLAVWPYGYLPVYLALFCSLLFGLFSVYWQRMQTAGDENGQQQARERARLLKERINNVVKKDRDGN